MKHAARRIRIALALLLVMIAAGFALQARAADLPLATASPLTGVSFDDRPLLLPIQRNFQMAMLTASSELGRSCGKMEAYGWRMNQTEQARVNQIFSNTVDHLRLMGYSIEPRSLTSVANDITVFTADSKSRHFIFLWSAGELGLVMNLCETPPPPVTAAHAAPTALPTQLLPVPTDVVSQHLDAPGKMPTQASSENFTPLGEWVGGYTCMQGYTGGTLLITHMDGKEFRGLFKFYPTRKNPNIPAGAYSVYGEYDKASGRILINPGKWLHRPQNYYNTVIVGSFDKVMGSFSAYFQGITGCTSFEAKRVGEPPVDRNMKPKKARKRVRHVVKNKPAPKPAAAITPVSVPLNQIMGPAPSPAPAPMAAPPSMAPAPVKAAPIPAVSEPAPVDSSGITLSSPAGK